VPQQSFLKLAWFKDGKVVYLAIGSCLEGDGNVLEIEPEEN